MTKKRKTALGLRRILIASAFWLSLLGSGPAFADGILLYEAGSLDVGLASAGWSARALDASAILTNPAGMTRLEGSQVMVRGQAYSSWPSISTGCSDRWRFLLEGGDREKGTCLIFTAARISRHKK